MLTNSDLMLTKIKMSTLKLARGLLPHIKSDRIRKRENNTRKHYYG